MHIEVKITLEYGEVEDPREIAELAQEAAFRSIRQGTYDFGGDDPADWEVEVAVPSKPDGTT